MLELKQIELATEEDKKWNLDFLGEVVQSQDLGGVKDDCERQ